ncbi:MAG: tetratricopeptide repeat protein [Bacteroidota bacterium]|nr:tetratricopeptide repeat protein [Bacteroidota bacterium]
MNVIIHILSSIFVYLLARKLISISGILKNESYINYGALAVALFFAAHPIQTMAVTYIVQRAAGLATLFYLASVFCYIHARTSFLTGGKLATTIGFFILTFITALLGVLSKQTAATLPLAYWLVELFFIRNNQNKAARKYLIIYGGLMLAAAIVVIASGNLPRETEHVTRWQYLITQFKVYLKYFQLILVPIGLNIDHGVLLSTSIKSKEFFGSLSILALMILGVFLYKKNRLISFGIFWFFITMSVESSILPIRDYMFEHRLYLPMFGLSLSIISAIYLLSKKNYRTFAYIMAPLLIILGYLTFDRNKDWKTNVTIWEASLRENPNNRRALLYVGRAYADEDWQKGLNYIHRAIKSDPNYYHGWLNRALVLYDNHYFEKAVESVDKALTLASKPHDFNYFIRGVSYLQLKKYEKALTDLNRYIEADKYNWEAYHYRGETLYNLQQLEDAAKNFEMAVALNPRERNIYLNLIQLYYMMEDKKNTRKFINLARNNGLKVDQKYIDFVGNQ